MKKLFLFFVVAFTTLLSGISQPITLTFTGVDTNQQWTKISRVIVTNVTRDWQETIYYPDTTFILENNVGIEDATQEVASDIMLNVAPNPFDGVTDIALTLPVGGAVQFDVTDIKGRVVITQSYPFLDAGTHSLRVFMDIPQTYFIRATQNGRSVAAKLLNVGRVGYNRLEYQGLKKENVAFPKYVSTKPYAKGDLMRYVAYVMVCGSLLQTQMIEENLTESKLITFFVNTQQEAAVVNTGTVGNITYETADGGGEVLVEGCGYVTARGVCWDTVNNPTIANSHTIDGNGLGAFVSHITGLIPHTTYFVRAYATNDVNTFYGNETSFTTDACQDTIIPSTDSICAGDSYSWHGNTYSTQGTYYDSVQIAGGCHRIYELFLKVNQSYTVNESDSFCSGGVYSWHGQSLTVAGVYRDTLQSVNGCDSVVILTLSNSQSYTVNESDSFCSGGVYSWHGQSLTVAGVYRDTLQSVSGCDSIVILTLSNSQSYTVNESDSFCSGGVYSWHGQSLTVAGVYRDTLQSVSGCDSVVILTLSNSQSYTVNESDSFCPGSIYSWHGQSLAVAGTYYDYMHTINGCDSIIVLNLTNKHSYYIVEHDTINSGTSLNWHGQSLTVAGTYYDSLVASNGCDSIYELNLVVNPFNPTCGPVTDIDGNTYPVVQLGTQCWMAENLRTTRYANGLAIPMGSAETYTNIAYKFNPGNSAANVATYGYLYNWRAVMGNSVSSSLDPSGIQGVCPDGWHVPSNAEWTTMINYVSSQTAYQCGTTTYIAKALASSSYWNSYNNNGTCYVGDLSYYPNNATGFDARPAGYYYTGSYTGLKTNTRFWSATESSTSAAYYRGMTYSSMSVSSGSTAKYYAYSVRCVKGAGTLLACTDTLIAESATMSYGSTYTWRGRTITEGGVYYDSLQRSGGCDSIYRLTLIVDCGTVTDVDGNTYNTVQIGTQCWMKENLKTTRYANGLAIPMGSAETYTNIAYKFNPGNSAANVATYGYLYNWRAVMGNSASSSSDPSGIQGVCPNGWHVPSDAEWTTLTSYITSHPNYTFSSTPSYNAKPLASSSYWSLYGNNGTYRVGDLTYPNNTSGFEALPAGYYYTGSYTGLKTAARFWSATESSTSSAYYRVMTYSSTSVSSGSTAKYYAYSVRCVKGAGTLLACTDTLIAESATMSYGSTYTWHGRTITEGGVYYDSLQRSGGCDSIHRLTLIVDCGTVTDIDGNTYNTVQIGTQCWMKENLKTTRYANGLAIPMGSAETYTNIAYKFNPGNSAANVATYGYLYNWRAVMGNSASSSADPSGIQGVCPNGWHVPSSAEWTTLTSYITSHPNYTFSSTPSYNAKPLASSSYWNVYNNNGTYSVGDPTYPNNTSGFEALPAGYYYSGSYTGLKTNTRFWSATESSTSAAYYRGMTYSSTSVSSSTSAKYYAYSVRCVKGAGTLLACTDTLIAESATMSYGSTYTWHGRTITEGGVYYDSLQRSGGCDSIHRLTLIVDCGTVTDIDGNTYNTVQIGTQCWMKENLKATRFADGTSIATGSTITYTSTPYNFYPGNSAANVATYGYLYNWYAVMNNAASSSASPSGVQGVCPNGWHIPSSAEWTTLTSYITSHPNYMFSSTPTYNAKPLASSSYWNVYNNNGTYSVGDPTYPNNTSGFEALPAGYFYSGTYTGLKTTARFWSTTESSTSSAYYRGMTYSSTSVSSSTSAKYYAYSVRCVKD